MPLETLRLELESYAHDLEELQRIYRIAHDRQHTLDIAFSSLEFDPIYKEVFNLFKHLKQSLRLLSDIERSRLLSEHYFF